MTLLITVFVIVRRDFIINLFSDAVGTLAGDGMRSVDGLVAGQKHLDDLVIVVVGGQDERCDVRRKLALFVGTKERVFLRASTELRPRNVVRMLDHHLRDVNIIIIIIIINNNNNIYIYMYTPLNIIATLQCHFIRVQWSSGRVSDS